MMLLLLLLAAENDLPEKAVGVLSRNCYSCHGSVAMAGLRLDQPEGLDDAIIVPGKPEESRLWLMMNGKGRAMMPPTGKLSAGDLAVVRDWIRAGAQWPASKPTAARAQWWAFEPVKTVAVPAGGHGWVRNEVDRFVAAKLESKGFIASPEADRRTLVRRVSFDLTGLPPTPEEVTRFLNDAAPRAYERMVERYLG